MIPVRPVYVYGLSASLMLGAAVLSLGHLPMPLGVAQSAPASSKTAERPAIKALAAHLKRTGVKMYGTYWCPYCKRQKKILGETVFRSIQYIECDAQGANPQPQRCVKANIESVPTWEIKGQFYPGEKTLRELAVLSGYKGSTQF
jgi:glutaredoxin